MTWLLVSSMKDLGQQFKSDVDVCKERKQNVTMIGSHINAYQKLFILKEVSTIKKTGDYIQLVLMVEIKDVHVITNMNSFS